MDKGGRGGQPMLVIINFCNIFIKSADMDMAGGRA